jgi:hypothetical protein
VRSIPVSSYSAHGRFADRIRRIFPALKIECSVGSWLPTSGVGHSTVRQATDNVISTKPEKVKITNPGKNLRPPARVSNSPVRLKPRSLWDMQAWYKECKPCLFFLSFKLGVDYQWRDSATTY